MGFRFYSGCRCGSDGSRCRRKVITLGAFRTFTTFGAGRTFAAITVT